MATGELIAVIARLAIGAAATFLAIFLWSKTRDAAWMLAILGVIIQYAGILYATFAGYGIVPAELPFAGVPVLRLLFENLPTLLIASAFLVVISRNRMR